MTLKHRKDIILYKYYVCRMRFVRYDDNNADIEKWINVHNEIVALAKQKVV